MHHRLFAAQVIWDDRDFITVKHFAAECDNVTLSHCHTVTQCHTVTSIRRTRRSLWWESQIVAVAVRQDDNKFIIPEGIFLGIPEGRAQNFFR